MLAGCNSLGFGGNKATDPVNVQSPTASTSATPASSTGTQGASVVQGSCPRVYMRDTTASYRSYAKGAKSGDPQQVVFQASFADVTRQCTLSDTNLSITVVAQGRLVAGPAGGPGRVNLPIRISVVDGDNTLYSEVTNFEAEIPAGAATAQFLFRKDGITIPGGAGGLARINLGFDEGPAKKTANKKS
ncbi:MULTISPECIES: hypothetical protein [unclassified Sinorhizobium]|uniref:hypothetical protein n=1 Tax=unclassified Sinorhizobium TaxID=2613772 RepID=UPI003524005A